MKAIYFFLFSLCLQAATAQPLQRVAPEQVGNGLTQVDVC